MKSIKVILIPGNGGSTPDEGWFPYVKAELEKIGIETINVQFPDSILARQEFWLPFIKELGADENTILIGHSSGAVAAMRFAETNKIFGSILVGACYTDLGIESEKQSGYFDKEWEWDTIKNNQNWIIQFASIDDPFVPITEARYIHEHLNTEYHEYADEGHFSVDKDKTIFPEIVEEVKNKIV
ncbi:MAG: esterase [Candidatus Taylorbacteria bacterium]|nr:esterase [Candidatus Taylorbacteria bacterium]